MQEQEWTQADARTFVFDVLALADIQLNSDEEMRVEIATETLFDV